jgi:Zn-dependent peptidase ImmA (M78 family)/transcriptional regulator with XRE-family HTH domain
MTTSGDLFRSRDLPQIIPERIKEAREARGYTRETFAEALAITPQAVGQYEVGQHAPGPEVMSKIIGLTGQPPAFFTADRPAVRERFGMPFWRSLARMRRADRLKVARRLEWSADVVAYIERFIELPPTQLPSITMPRDFSDFEALEIAAERVRDAWQLGSLPIGHMAATLESNGIVIIKETVHCEDMDAVSRWQAGKPYILLSADKNSLPRENFDLAHELAHLLCHPHIEVNSDNLASIERQANYFAGALLLPRKSFPQEVMSTSLNYFLELKSRWRVSVQAMVYRCKDLGLLNKNQVAYLWRQLSKMRSFEPLDDAFEPERPTLLSAALSMLVENGVQTRAQIVEALKLNHSDIEQLCGTSVGFLDQKVVRLELKQKRHQLIQPKN